VLALLQCPSLDRQFTRHPPSTIEYRGLMCGRLSCGATGCPASPVCSVPGGGGCRCASLLSSCEWLAPPVQEWAKGAHLCPILCPVHIFHSFTPSSTQTKVVDDRQQRGTGRASRSQSYLHAHRWWWWWWCTNWPAWVFIHVAPTRFQLPLRPTLYHHTACLPLQRRQLEFACDWTLNGGASCTRVLAFDNSSTNAHPYSSWG